MGITEFREKVKVAFPNMNAKELQRLKALTNRSLKQSLKSVLGVGVDVTDENLKKAWHGVNKIEAHWEVFHRQQTHMMRTTKRKFVDYSSTAYNNHTDDL